MKKKYLMAPGPTPVSPEVLLEMAQPIIHHRSPQFSEILAEVREGLKYLFQTKNEVLTLVSTGTGGMEGSVSNLLAKGDKGLVVRGGKFGERWAQIISAYGLTPVNIDVEWGYSPDPGVIRDHLKKDSAIKAVYVQAHETSTGVKFPIQEIGAVVKEFSGVALVVDAISALGVYDIKTDDWGLDVVVSGSQKAMGLPPGLAFVSLSGLALEMMGRSDLPKFYFDFKKERKNLLENKGAYTSAVSLVFGLRKVLRDIKAEGLESMFARHALLAKATRAAAKGLGLAMFPKDSPSETLTAFLAPEGMDAGKIVKILRDKHGVTVAGGQDTLKGKIFRISHMGYVDRFDLITAISALEMTLMELGYKFEIGAGVKAAEEVLMGGAQ
ncbi:MAG: alanine--glyoxylate aminotransferase family protein [Deltaproteobacteria bacterium]|nr:alanine--glyoxylate aminotransferase family protein [Deltaproteobacteria bacterium]